MGDKMYRYVHALWNNSLFYFRSNAYWNSVWKMIYNKLLTCKVKGTHIIEYFLFLSFSRQTFANIKLENTQRVQTSVRNPPWILSKVMLHAEITSGSPISAGCQIWWRNLKPRPIELRRFWPWTLTLTSGKLTVTFVLGDERMRRISWKSGFYFSRNHNERYERTNQPTNKLEWSQYLLAEITPGKEDKTLLQHKLKGDKKR